MRGLEFPEEPWPARFGELKRKIQLLGLVESHSRGLVSIGCALFGRCVAATGEYGEGGEDLAFFLEIGLKLFYRQGKVSSDIVIERLQGRDIEDPRPALAPDAGDQLIDGPKKGRQRLAAARGCRHQGVSPWAISGQACT